MINSFWNLTRLRNAYSQFKVGGLLSGHSSNSAELHFDLPTSGIRNVYQLHQHFSNWLALFPNLISIQSENSSTIAGIGFKIEKTVWQNIFPMRYMFTKINTILVPRQSQKGNLFALRCNTTQLMEYTLFITQLGVLLWSSLPFNEIRDSSSLPFFWKKIKTQHLGNYKP